MLTPGGVKLLDFGLAKLRRPVAAAEDKSAAKTFTQALTERGAIPGTPQYMAPEQLEGKEADPRTDVFWALAVVLLLAVLAAVPWVRSGRGVGAGSAPRPDPPVIVLMDSPLADRVYDPRTLASGGTNADDITDILRDLDVELHKETTSPAWHREEQVLKQRPRLVVAHLSCLRDDRGMQEGSPMHDLLRDQAWDRLRALMAYWGSAEPQTRFLLYSRGFPTQPERDQFVSDLVQRFPALRSRVLMFHVPGDERASFRDPATAAALRQQVVAMLREEWRAGD